MVPIYATALAAGGTLLLISLLLGHHGGGHGELEGGDGLDHHLEGSDALGLVLSMRFWTVAVAFFGLTGVVFEEFKLAEGRAVLALSIGLGGGMGLAATWIVRRLRRQVVNSLPTEIGYVGLVGEMLLDADGQENGRIRIKARGSLVDLPARSHNKDRLAKGSQALVVDVTDGVASVTPAPGPAPAGQNGSS